MDVRLFQTDDGGDVAFSSPNATITDLELDPGLETASYLSMFGGNERDSGLGTIGEAGSPVRLQWWGNLGEPPSRQMRSETGHLLLSLPAISANLLKIEDAVTRDHQWFLDEGLASEVEASASLIAKDKIRIQVRLVVEGEELVFLFQTQWVFNGA